MKNKIISLEGTDCSGKTTQYDLLTKRLKENGYKIEQMSFPCYDTPTGRVLADCYLGRDGKEPYFPEGASKVDGKVAGLFFAMDRLYNIGIIKDKLANGHLFLDRYVDSNIAFNGAKLTNKNERIKTYEFFERLEYDLLELPQPDIRILLHMPFEFSKKLKAGREELEDQLEKDDEFQKNVEQTYLEIAKRYNYHIVKCVKDNQIRTIQDIHEELYNYVTSLI